MDIFQYHFVKAGDGVRRGPSISVFALFFVTSYFGVSRWHSWKVRWRPTVVHCHWWALVWRSLEISGWGYVTYSNIPSFDFTFLPFFFVIFLSCLFSLFWCALSNFSRYRGPHLRVNPDSVFSLSTIELAPSSFSSLFLLIMNLSGTLDVIILTFLNISLTCPCNNRFRNIF